MSGLNVRTIQPFLPHRFEPRSVRGCCSNNLTSSRFTPHGLALDLPADREIGIRQLLS